jgi:integrase
MSSSVSVPRKPGWPRNLTNRNGRFYTQVRVPESLRGVVTTGRGTHLRRSLHTANEAEAIRRHPHIEADLKKVIEAARRDPDGTPKGRDASARDVAWWREHLGEKGIRPADALRDFDFDMTVDRMLGDPIGAEIDGDGNERPFYDEAREARASAFVDEVRGDRVPVAAELERFFEDKARQRGKPLSTRYVSRIRRAVRDLSSWLAKRPEGDNIKGLTKYVAGHFAEYLSKKDITAQTVSSLLTALSSYWEWMEKRGAVEGNPWRGQAPEVRTSPGDASKRSYTDDEVKRLLSGDTYSTLHDMMRIAALSGMRINEIGRLKVGDCAAAVFDIGQAKTNAGVRRVPIHPTLAPIIERRSASKTPDAFLFAELSARKDHTGDRAAKASERFTAYRQSCGIDERKPGQRQSNIDFHSFRRWFVTKAEQAGQPPHVISSVVGHAEGREGMTLSKYSGGPSEQQMREVVESVRLPEGTPTDKPEGSRMGDGRWPQRARPMET